MEQQNTPKQLYSPQIQLGKQVTELISENQLTKKLDKLTSALKSGDTSDDNALVNSMNTGAKKTQRNFDSLRSLIT